MSDEKELEWTVIPFSEPEEAAWDVHISVASDDLLYIGTPRGEEEVACHGARVSIEVGDSMNGVRIVAGYANRGWDMHYYSSGEYEDEWRASIRVEDGKPMCRIECPCNPPVKYRIEVRGDGQ